MKYTELDRNTCTVEDVITVSVGMHPSLLVECLSAQARVHQEYSRITPHENIAHYAKGMATACMQASSVIAEGDGSAREVAAIICANERMRLCIFPEAARLLLIPGYVQKEIKERSK